MKTNFQHTLFFCLLLSMSSCKDFLEETPPTIRTTDNAYKTAIDFNNAVIGTYATFKHTGLYGNGGTNAGMLWMTEVVSDNCTYGSPKAVNTLPAFEIDEFNPSLSNPIISSVWTGNYIGIGRANTILDKLPAASFDPAQQSRYEAEARFLRAFFYFNLVRLFGDVPLVEKSVTNPFELNNQPRTAAATIYERIISDLTVAENNLPETIVTNEAGRASKWAAKALLGKVYMTRKQFDKAQVKLNEVITSNQFNVSNPYPAVFNFATGYAANKDVIFSVQYKSGQVGQGSALWSDVIPNAAGSLFGTTGTGSGFMKPTEEMINAYEPNDLRKEASLALTYQDATNKTINQPYVVKYKQTGPQSGDADTDFPLLRYADVLLMHAEALNAQGNSASAEPFLNQVRTRAGLSPINGLDQANMALALENERRVELAFEGQRWFDLVRTDRYLPVLTAKGYAVKEYHRLCPVPQRETDLNTQLGQNTGY